MKEFDPSGDSASIVSVTDKVRPVAIGAPVIAVHFLGDKAAFVGAEENVALVNGAGDISRVAVHGGGILCGASDGERIIMGGDDDRYVFQGVHMMLEGDHQRAWKEGEPRESRLVFIGRELPEQMIRDGFENCIVA